jgi:hypothetical protein
MGDETGKVDGTSGGLRSSLAAALREWLSCRRSTEEFSRWAWRTMATERDFLDLPLPDAGHLSLLEHLFQYDPERLDDATLFGELARETLDALDGEAELRDHHVCVVTSPECLSRPHSLGQYLHEQVGCPEGRFEISFDLIVRGDDVRVENVELGP